MIINFVNNTSKGDQFMLKISKEEILNVLTNGVKPEDIANSFTSVLNDAIKEQERAADQKKKEEKLADSRTLARSIGSFLSKYYPELGIVAEAIPFLDGTEIVKMFDDIVKSIPSILPTGSKSPDNKSSAATPATPFTTPGSSEATFHGKYHDTDDKVLKEFLEHMGL